MERRGGSCSGRRGPRKPYLAQGGKAGAGQAPLEAGLDWVESRGRECGEDGAAPARATEAQLDAVVERLSSQGSRSSPSELEALLHPLRRAPKSLTKVLSRLSKRGEPGAAMRVFEWAERGGEELNVYHYRSVVTPRPHSSASNPIFSWQQAYHLHRRIFFTWDARCA